MQDACHSTGLLMRKGLLGVVGNNHNTSLWQMRSHMELDVDPGSQDVEGTSYSTNNDGSPRIDD